jgi:hypothetical protein
MAVFVNSPTRREPSYRQSWIGSVPPSLRGRPFGL